MHAKFLGAPLPFFSSPPIPCAGMNTAPDRERPERLSWGPGAWVFLQACVFTYPEEPSLMDRWLYERFLLTCMRVLPCGLCRDSTAIYLAKHPIGAYLHCRQALTVWIYKMHHLVNRKLGKKSCHFLDFVRRYEDMRAKCNPSKTGCTEAFEWVSDKNNTSDGTNHERDIAAWAHEAFRKYWDFERGEQRWREGQRLFIFCAAALTSLIAVISFRFLRQYRIVPRRMHIQKHF